MPKFKNKNLQSIVVVGYFAKSVPLRNFILLNISYPFDVSSKEIVVFLNTSLFNYKHFMVIITLIGDYHYLQQLKLQHQGQHGK